MPRSDNHSARRRRPLIEQLEPRHVLCSSLLGELVGEPVGEASSVEAEPAIAYASSESGYRAPQTASLVSVSTANAARDALLAGVSQIATVGAPGQVAVFDPPGAGPGQGAFGVMHDGAHRPIVAAALWGSGKVVAFGQNGYVNFDNVGNALDTGQFYLNSVAWASDVAGTSAAIVTPSTGTRDWLLNRGFTNVSVHSDWENHLTGADLLVAELGPNVSSAKQTAVSNFVQTGGGLITGGTGWGYKSLGNDLKTMDGNVVLREAGLGWADGFRNGTTDATQRSTRLANASQALAFAEAYWAGGGGTSSQLAEAGEALQTVIEVLPSDHPLAVDIADAFAARAAAISATPATPVSETLDQAVLTWEALELLAVPADEVTAHHTAEAVYGAISQGTPRVTDTVMLDTSRTRWHATGLYAAPGDLVTVTVPASMVGQGYKLRIGAHTDNISPRDAWERMPIVHRSYDIDQTTVEVASAFGGSIFVDFGGSRDSPPPNLGDLPITIAGAIRQPYFVLGEHTDQQWIDTLRDYPAPYAVFVSENLIISQRSSESATLTEPTALMTWWNDVVAQQDHLAARLQPRTSAELINVDVQNSAGAAHAGFPIQAYDKFWGNLADWSSLPNEGSWGDFHELGHNQQRGWWTFSGDVEVSVNIFSNQSLEAKAAPPTTDGWGYSTYPVATLDRAITAVQQGGTYSSKSDRWSFWFQLADGFGFDTYREVFRSYELDLAINPNALPSGDQQEKDQWFTRWSNEVGYDMKQFMVDTWGLSVSQAAINSVAALPDWMPLATVIGDITLDPGETQVIDAAGGGRSMDGVATFTGVTAQPSFGNLTDNGDGTFTYEPTIVSGKDTFAVSYQSSAGNVQEFAVKVTIGSGFLPGDVNLDQQLTMADIDQFIANWRSDTTGLSPELQYNQGDLNLNGTTDFADWFLLRQAWTAAGGGSLDFAALLAGPSDGGQDDPPPPATPTTVGVTDGAAAPRIVVNERFLDRPASQQASQSPVQEALQAEPRGAVLPLDLLRLDASQGDANAMPTEPERSGSAAVSRAAFELLLVESSSYGGNDSDDRHAIDDHEDARRTERETAEVARRLSSDKAFEQLTRKAIVDVSHYGR